MTSHLPQKLLASFAQQHLPTLETGTGHLTKERARHLGENTFYSSR